MATWAKIKFYYNTMLGSAGSTLTAMSTAAGDYLVAYLYNMMETNKWLAANTTSPHYITYDAGVGNAKAADYIAILGHNLKAAGASIYLQWSDDNAVWTDAYSDTPTADTVYLKEFAATATHRYWRLKITGMSVPVYMTLCVWGLKTELYYVSTSFDPYEQNYKASINLSQGGYVTGIHRQYAERTMRLTFNDADATLYDAVKAWWDTSEIKNFFIAWEIANNPSEVFLMRPDTRFSNPFSSGGGLYRDITINLMGRKE